MLKCNLCGKKTKVLQSTLRKDGQVRRTRACSDDECESLPFKTYEKRSIKYNVNYERGDDEKPNS